jgi:hypothetical protein
MLCSENAIDAAQWANLPAIGRCSSRPTKSDDDIQTVRRRDGRGHREFLSPLIGFRETIIDYWLISIVALAIWFLIHPKEFRIENA